MLQARFDCNTVVIALEGGGYKDSSGAFHDPEGAVVTVKFPNGPRGSAQPVVNTLDFRKYNQRFDTLEPSGVRFVYRDNNSFSNDVEPEFVTLDEKSHTAYVCLQENNAIAVVDLTSENIEHVYGLGFKHWGHFDASNKDQGIQISYWPIRAWYQPDAVLFYTFQGRRLIFSANEGDAKQYSDFDEIERGKKLKNVSSTVPKFVRASLQDDALLGRLKFSSVDGKDEQGNYQHLYTYGGRSFSVWDADQGMTQIYDSGSHIEESTALHCPHLFNMDGNDEQPDSRSDDKGPEPESLALAEVRGRLYVFVGNERPGTISVYSFGSDLTKPRFETIFCDGIPDDSRTPDQRFADRDLFAVDPEDIQYLSEEESPAPYPVLLVAGTVSGTVSIVRVNITDEPGDGDPKPPNNGNTYAAGSVWVLAASLLVTWFKTREISA
ncbi:mesenchyme-specific cell surface glycoprotein [Aplysia californica]|uniref:Mesenchyme-specific cell surface glycoprotein n=1 Tax=Aplysia californica TaxID=6500 RepID=A0ABM0ZX48_APLCA|nr:mesenchyme-specific cell surface glycoprotein [Aplysia californica]